MAVAKVGGAVAVAAVLTLVANVLLLGWFTMLAVPLVGEVIGAQNPPHPGFWLSTGAVFLAQIVVKALLGRK